MIYILQCLPGYFCGSSGLTKPEGSCGAGHYCAYGAKTPTPVDGVTGGLCGGGHVSQIFYFPFQHLTFVFHRLVRVARLILIQSITLEVTFVPLQPNVLLALLNLKVVLLEHTIRQLVLIIVQIVPQDLYVLVI